ncbi:predicted protein [Chaetoceros tenuissimus]|uniref:Uncharacterized protein n=1 Tax=Chaetoceros tenuissimus TaxID=426638 RepID=A0AAD3CXK6_9STRA|nr:predicted protein [Chaetoceros tenuissimus]
MEALIQFQSSFIFPPACQQFFNANESKCPGAFAQKSESCSSSKDQSLYNELCRLVSIVPIKCKLDIIDLGTYDVQHESHWSQSPHASQNENSPLHVLPGNMLFHNGETSQLGYHTGTLDLDQNDRLSGAFLDVHIRSCEWFLPESQSQSNLDIKKKMRQLRGLVAIEPLTRNAMLEYEEFRASSSEKIMLVKPLDVHFSLDIDMDTFGDYNHQYPSNHSTPHTFGKIFESFSGNEAMSINDTALEYLHNDPVLVFLLCFLAIISICFADILVYVMRDPESAGKYPFLLGAVKSCCILVEKCVMTYIRVGCCYVESVCLGFVGLLKSMKKKVEFLFSQVKRLVVFLIVSMCQIFCRVKLLIFNMLVQVKCMFRSLTSKGISFVSRRGRDKKVDGDEYKKDSDPDPQSLSTPPLGENDKCSYPELCPTTIFSECEISEAKNCPIFDSPDGKYNSPESSPKRPTKVVDEISGDTCSHQSNTSFNYENHLISALTSDRGQCLSPSNSCVIEAVSSPCSELSDQITCANELPLGRIEKDLAPILDACEENEDVTAVEIINSEVVEKVCENFQGSSTTGITKSSNPSDSNNTDCCENDRNCTDDDEAILHLQSPVLQNFSDMNAKENENEGNNENVSSNNIEDENESFYKLDMIDGKQMGLHQNLMDDMDQSSQVYIDATESPDTKESRNHVKNSFVPNDISLEDTSPNDVEFSPKSYEEVNTLQDTIAQDSICSQCVGSYKDKETNKVVSSLKNEISSQTASTVPKLAHDISHDRCANSDETESNTATLEIQDTNEPTVEKTEDVENYQNKGSEERCITNAATSSLKLNCGSSSPIAHNQLESDSNPIVHNEVDDIFIMLKDKKEVEKEAKSSDKKVGEAEEEVDCTKDMVKATNTLALIRSCMEKQQKLKVEDNKMSLDSSSKQVEVEKRSSKEDSNCTPLKYNGKTHGAELDSPSSKAQSNCAQVQMQQELLAKLKTRSNYVDQTKSESILADSQTAPKSNVRKPKKIKTPKAFLESRETTMNFTPVKSPTLRTKIGNKNFSALMAKFNASENDGNLQGKNTVTPNVERTRRKIISPFQDADRKAQSENGKKIRPLAVQKENDREGKADEGASLSFLDEMLG